MNKTKRIMTAVVSLVLASTMCFSIAACTNESGTSTSTSSGSTSTGSTDSSAADSSSSGSTTVDQITLTPSQTALTPNATINSDGTVTYNYASTTKLNMNVGYQKSGNEGMGISYLADNFSGSVTMPDGVTYKTGDLKPAWKALSDKLGIGFDNGFTNLSASAQISTNVSQGILNNYNVITGQGATIVTSGTADSNLFLDLSLYLDYMPNYKKFLQDNPIVYMSLTSDVDSGAMYYAPYFDGNDDIEKYEIAKKNWATAVLDSTYTSSNTISFATQASSKASAITGGSSTYGIDGTSSSVESFMGTTGSWWVESTDPADESKTVTITIDYDDALTAAKNESSALGAAYKAATNSVYSGESGNIVDIQNAAIDATNGAVTGAQLTEMLRAYIDVAYQGSDGKSYYATRADVFNGADACWDVDLLVALMRCIVTFGNGNLGTDSANADIYGLTGRQANSQRESDMYSLAGELYGKRGFTSRYSFSYIDSTGALQEARAEEETYEVLEKMHAMVEEGLLNVSGTQSANYTSYYTKSGAAEAYMIYDYVQTQTAKGGYIKMGIASGTVEDDYDFEPIVTPVSKWNDGDTSKDANVDGISYDYDDATGTYKYMRFTESWRSVKNTGFCVPRASVENDPDKLAAVLAFIDYFFSNDGQILMTFGGQSSTDNCKDPTQDYTGESDDGWWYATKVTDVDISTVATMVGGQYYIKDEYASQYFCYNNELYTGTKYNGKMYPTMTGTNLAFYYGKSVNGVSQSKDSGFSNAGVQSYTDYARYQIGSALPIGNKLQAFEYQCTADMGIKGADIVAQGLVNGTISHVYLGVGADNGKGYWYTIVPTTLPYDSITSSWISENTTTLDNTVFANSSDIKMNYFIDIIQYGLGNTAYNMSYISSTQTVPATAADCVSLLTKSYNLGTYVTYMQRAWEDALYFYQGYIVYIGK